MDPNDLVPGCTSLVIMPPASTQLTAYSRKYFCITNRARSPRGLSHDEPYNSGHLLDITSPGRVGSDSMLNSAEWNLWDNESLNHGRNSANSTDFVGGRSGVAGYGTLGGLGTIWGASSISGQGDGNGSFCSGNFTNSGEAGGAGYGRNSVTTSPYAPEKDTHLLCCS